MHPLYLLPLLATPLTAYRGDLTYYDPGRGSCGAFSNPSDNIVALSIPMMANGANPNANPKCFSRIKIRNPESGQVVEAMVVDTCVGCKGEDLDASPGLFGRVAPGGDGRVEGVEWWR